MNILQVLNKEYTTVLASAGDEAKGHWLVKEDHHHPLYSQSKKLTGAQVIDQITRMQSLIDRLSIAQARLVSLIEE